MPFCHQMVWIQITADILSVLIWVKTVCKGYQQATKMAARKEFIQARLYKLKGMFMVLNIILKSKIKYFIMYLFNFHRSFLHLLS